MQHNKRKFRKMVYQPCWGDSNVSNSSTGNTCIIPYYSNMHEVGAAEMSYIICDKVHQATVKIFFIAYKPSVTKYN